MSSVISMTFFFKIFSYQSYLSYILWTLCNAYEQIKMIQTRVDRWNIKMTLYDIAECRQTLGMVLCVHLFYLFIFLFNYFYFSVSSVCFKHFYNFHVQVQTMISIAVLPLDTCHML